MSSLTKTNADPLAYLADELDELRRQNLYRPLRVMTGPQAVHTTVDGRPVISLSSNNYLGLTTHPRLVEAAAKAVRELGVGTGAVRTIAGATGSSTSSRSGWPSSSRSRPC